MNSRSLNRTVPIAASAALLAVTLPAFAVVSPDDNWRTDTGRQVVVADAAPLTADRASAGMHHVYSCDTVNHTWNDVVVPNQPGSPTQDIVDPMFRNMCPFGDPMVPSYRPVANVGGMHHVYSCDTVNHTWNDAMVPNVPGGPSGDVVEPFYRNGCPYGSPTAGFQGTAAAAPRPYVDSGNPLDPSHKFH